MTKPLEVRLDADRLVRCGHPEAIWSEGKSDAQIADAITQLDRVGQPVLVTRVDHARANRLRALVPDV